jgi:hypothetical protein
MKTKLVFNVSMLLAVAATTSFAAHNVTPDPFSSAGEEAIPQLIEAAEKLDPDFIEMKIQAIQRLGELGAEEAVPVLIEALGSVLRPSWLSAERKGSIPGRFAWSLLRL